MQIQTRLPAAPGMIIRMPLGENINSGSQNVLLHCYHPQEEVFVVSPADDPSSIQSVPASQFQARSGKIYPVLEALMHRADETAVATRHLLESEATQTLLDQTGQAVQNTASRLLQQNNPTSTVVESLTTAARDAAPPQGWNQVLAMVKDEQLTDLLVTCRDRLSQLVQNDVSESTRQVLGRAGVRIDLAPVEESRQEALSAIDRFLQQAKVNPTDLQTVRDDLSANFNQAFDSLSAVARSDRGLHQLFESIAERTTAWQQATGRLLQTRSASLFLEGASRLQARAASLLKKQGNVAGWAGEIGSKLTKSFTEGDAAVARIKSIELGEAVKTRLVEAIEVRSESLGGLDGIIAEALATIETKSKIVDGSPIQSLLTDLQSNATSVTKDAHETLITVLSSKSQYRDLALIRLETVMWNLEGYLGDDMTPEDIAAIVRGEGGTSRFFGPIAKRAMQQIDKQLDAAESQVSDDTVLEVLSRVRKIMSGEMDLSAVMDEVVAVLNADQVVAASETLVQHSEKVLDVLEGVSGQQGSCGCDTDCRESRYLKGLSYARNWQSGCRQAPRHRRKCRI